jgi:hypothetical protein
MIGKANSCEHPCSCQSPSHDTRLVVLTGGPGAGKTAVLEFVKKVLCEHVAVLPEAASILFGGGFWRLESLSAKTAAQRAIYQVQKEMENLVVGERKWSIGLCDRGTLDGLAYWPGKVDEFHAILGTSVADEFKRYTAVIHLQSPSVEMGYNHQNPIRTESAEVAAQIDERIHEIWKSHPNYTLIGGFDNFLDKVRVAAKQIQFHLPKCCKEHLAKIGI